MPEDQQDGERQRSSCIYLVLLLTVVSASYVWQQLPSNWQESRVGQFCQGLLEVAYPHAQHALPNVLRGIITAMGHPEIANVLAEAVAQAIDQAAPQLASLPTAEDVTKPAAQSGVQDGEVNRRCESQDGTGESTRGTTWELLRKSTRVSTWESVRKSTCQSLHKSTCESLHKSTCESLHKSTCESLHKSTCESLHKSTCESVHESTCESLHKSTWESVHESTCKSTRTEF